MHRQSGRVKRKIRTLLFLVSAALIVAIVVCIGVINAQVPFATLFSAYELPARGEGEMRLHFLSVGQGSCTVVEFPDGTALVVDAGDGTSASHITRYLKAIQAPSYTFLATHADADHCGGFSALLGQVNADMVYLPAVEKAGNAYHALLAAIKRTGVQTGTLSRYDTLGDPLGGYAVCLSPYANETYGGDGSSTVLFVSYAGVNALLGADISSAREVNLLNEYQLFEPVFDSSAFTVRLSETEILQVSHHGSESASSAAWLSLLGAKTAIISCGKGNLYGHPASETLSRLAKSGAEIYRTDELGDIMIVISKDGTYRVQTNFFA